MTKRKTPRVPKSRTKPRWMHDHCDDDRPWPRYGNGWRLTVFYLEPHLDSIGRQDGVTLHFVEEDYPPMIVPFWDVKPSRPPRRFWQDGMIRPGYHVVMDKDGTKRFCP